MPSSEQEKFIEEVLKLVDRWSFQQCAYCNNGILVSIDGMLDFKCSKCGKTMNPIEYLGEITKLVSKYREKLANPKKLHNIEQ